MERFFRNEENGIIPALKDLIRSADHFVVGIGATFGNSMESCRELITARMRAGIRFRFMCLANTAAFDRYASRAGLTVEDFAHTVRRSLEELEKMRTSAPDAFSYHPVPECPPYRIFIADPDSMTPRGIVVFGGAGASEGVDVSNFIGSSLESMYKDALRWIDGVPGRANGPNGEPSAVDRAGAPEDSRNVFVIHGYDEARRLELKALLQEMGVEPVAPMDIVVGGAVTAIERFEECARKCSFAVALLTPDDLVGVDRRSYRHPRPDLIWELGYFCGRITRKRVVVLTQGDLPPLSDYNSNLAGINPLVFRTNVSEIYQRLSKELAAAGLIP
jgi:predicted nucleotide-binding protein